jgi:hypothetical protein
MCGFAPRRTLDLAKTLGDRLEEYPAEVEMLLRNARKSTLRNSAGCDRRVQGPVGLAGVGQ